MELILMLLLGLTLGLIGGFLYAKSQYGKQLEQQLQLIKAEMFSASERILKERARELSDSNEQQL